MLTRIIKRDGREVPFNIEKIANVIFKAESKVYDNVNYDDALKLSEKVVKYIEDNINNNIPSVEEIQDTVERVLMENNLVEAAKHFILYRSERTKVREMNTRLMKIYEDLTFKEAKDSDLKRENANIDGDTSMGTMLKYGSEGAKQFYELFLINPDHIKAHKNGDIHIHDLDFFGLTTTCCQIDLDKLFNNGFCTGHGYLREPSEIRSYSALACIAIQSNQNDQHGGQSIPNFDYYLSKGVYKTFKKLYTYNLIKCIELLSGKNYNDDIKKNTSYLKDKYDIEPSIGNLKKFQIVEKFELFRSTEISSDIVESAQEYAGKYALLETEKETYQAMEALIHNLNTMASRAGAQIPFSSINYGTDTSPEGRMVIKNVLLVTEAGLGNGETPIFPIQIFKVKEGINYNKEDKNYDLFKLACKVSAKRLFPNFSFIDAPFNLKYYKEGRPESEVSTMGCRTRVLSNINDTNRQISTGRGNLSFTTINLPRIALNNEGDIHLFYKELTEKINLVVGQLLERFEIQGKKKVKNYPFLMGQGVWLDSEKLNSEDTIREILKHGTLSVGFIGLAETLKILTGKHHGESETSQKLGLDIITHMRKLMDATANKYLLNFSLLATPAEGLSGRFIEMDRELFGSIDGVTDKEYYTNSFHIPVYYKISSYDKIRLEAPYHDLCNAGHITYVELDGDVSNNIEIFEKIVRCMKEHGIGYGAINHPTDRDPVCGYNGIINDICPSCGREENGINFERIRRITGYLVGTLDRFNNAKKAEVRDRVKHN